MRERSSKTHMQNVRQHAERSCGAVKDQYGRIHAVLNVESDRRDAYGDDEKELVTASPTSFRWS